MTVGDRIRKVRQEQDVTQQELADYIGVSKQAVYKYENNIVTNIPTDKVDAIAKRLRVSPAYLMGWEEQPAPAASREPTVPPGFEPMPAMDVVPLVGRIACGTPITAEENIEQMVCVPSRWHSTFTLTCKGDSMEPRIHDGDLVAIRSQPEVENGEIGDLNTGMLQDVLNRAYKEGSMNQQATRKSRGNLSRKTLQGIRAVEVSFVKWARQHKYTALRPEDEGLTVPRGARPKGRKILQPDALRVLLSTDTRIVRGKVEQDANIHAYRFAVLTGLRPGELLGLRVGDVEGNRLHLARAINTFDEETHGKNENAIRTVVLHPLAAAELHAQLQQRAFEEERPLRGDDPIFLLENEHSLYNYWQFYQRSNGIDPPVSLYELRHTFVSIIEDAVSPAELRRMVGHSKSMDTYGWYSHAVDGRADTAAMAVSDALAEYSPRAK